MCVCVCETGRGEYVCICVCTCAREEIVDRCGNQGSPTRGVTPNLYITAPYKDSISPKWTDPRLAITTTARLKELRHESGGPIKIARPNQTVLNYSGESYTYNVVITTWYRIGVGLLWIVRDLWPLL